MSNQIEVPNFTLEKAGMQLEYDGWRDRVQGAICGAHSNHKETRWYRFTCDWANSDGELSEFVIAARHQHPDHWLKGTASENRQDVRKVARRVSRLWREEKLTEQERLRQVTTDAAAIEIRVSPEWSGGRRQCCAWWIAKALLLEPSQFGRACRAGWIDVLPIGQGDMNVAKYITQVYADVGDEELACRAARRGLSLSEIKYVMNIREEKGWQEAEEALTTRLWQI
jgi:hypothetical protein